MRARASKKARLAEVKTSSEPESELETVTPQKLWDEHISQRKSKLLHSQLKRGNWNTDAWLRSFPEYLKEQAVGAEIQSLINCTASCAILMCPVGQEEQTAEAVSIVACRGIAQLRWS